MNSTFPVTFSHLMFSEYKYIDLFSSISSSIVIRRKNSRCANNIVIDCKFVFCWYWPKQVLRSLYNEWRIWRMLLCVPSVILEDRITIPVLQSGVPLRYPCRDKHTVVQQKCRADDRGRTNTDSHTHACAHTHTQMHILMYNPYSTTV